MKIFLKRISIIIIVILILLLVGSACSSVLDMRQHSVAASNASPLHNSSGNVIPCCGENNAHLAFFDIPSSNPLFSLVSLVLVIVLSGLLFLLNNLSKFLQPLPFLILFEPALLLIVEKRE